MENPLGQRLRELPGPVLLTGHTGFKGTWMTFLLEHLNVPVIGYSLKVEKDSLFDRAQRKRAIPEVFADIRNYEEIEKFIDEHKPSTIIHMAAQPLVLKSYENPRQTFEINVMGTVNLLDIAFKKEYVKAIIVVTTDKVYKNDNSGHAFVESDPLEGKDPYSASKVGTEAVVAAWQQIARVSGGPKVISVRAGNVIGGGDFSENRIIPDLIRGAIEGKDTVIRNPTNTRPWQHVLDPLYGYLLALEQSFNDSRLTNLNFGPSGFELTTKQLVDVFNESFFLDIQTEITTKTSALESEYLSIDSSFAQEILGWKSLFSSEEAICMTSKWWNFYLQENKRASDLCIADIRTYEERLNKFNNLNSE